MNLHSIPKENTNPIIPEDWLKTVANFQGELKNTHPIVMTVRGGEVVDIGYRNANFDYRLQVSGLSDRTTVINWRQRAKEYTLDWSLVEFIYE